MGRTKKQLFDLEGAVESWYKLVEQQPLLPFLVPLLLFLWAVEKWFFSLSNWLLLVCAVWATIQYGRYQQRNIVDDLNKKWMQVTLNTSPVTPLEHCEWLNKLLMEVWLNYINPKLSSRFASIIERRLKHRKSRLIERIELQGFSLGSRPPLLGLQGACWATSGDQRILRCSFDWDSDDVNILLSAKLAMPLMGTARIIVNSIHVKGNLLFMPILEGKAIAYSFVSTPEVRLGVAFGSGGSQSLPATELPGVSSWLVKLATETLNKRMVEPRRQCLALPPEDLHKKAVGGILYVTVLSASKLSGHNLKSNGSSKQFNFANPDAVPSDNKELQTFVEIELEELTRKTDCRAGSSPKWDSTFNLILHENAGVLKFHLYQRTPGSIKYDYLTCCEVKIRYVQDDSTIFWAIGDNNSVIAKHADVCGKEIEMTIPFEGGNLGEGKDLLVKDKIGKSDPYVKLQYGKAVQRTKPVPHSSNPTWNQRFEFDEIGGGEYLKVKCLLEETLGDESLGSARVNLEGLVEGSIRDVYIPLEKVNSGELRLQIEAIKVDDGEISRGLHTRTNGWIELVLIEARDLVAADLRGTSDPYVRIHYGNLKKSTKVMYKTLSPKWHQTLEFPDDGSPLTLHVKDHNTLLPTSSIGDCVVEYQMLAPNQMAEKWIPLQGVKRGEIHIQVTRKVPELEKRSSVDSESSPTKVRHEILNRIKETMIKLRSQVDIEDSEAVSESLSELESLHESQEEYLFRLETEQIMLIDKINELGQEIFNSSPSLLRTSTIP
ncbi:hypothetical protein SASPL_112983 [Salvia splendens]|uniref:Uncharacterized protein n=1 Tax=Salvia splendens TaxID=180675 RepID=A0A8X9A4Q4_SALSN|nr:hypothetical protein SASPL_112983 [Salvia splendens]